MGIGDEMMVTGHVRELRLKDPRKVRLDYGGKQVWSEVFDHNPGIARYDEAGDFQVYHARVNNLRPYCARKEYGRWTWKDYRPQIGEIFFTPEELAFAHRFTPDVVIEPSVKAKASPNKHWGLDRWRELIAMMLAAGLRPVQLERAGTQWLPGAMRIETPTFRLACAVLARARAAVVHEGGMHHGAAAVGTRAVVIYGGFISPQQTGYDTHVNLFTGGTPCGSRYVCRHCKNAMHAITPQAVMRHVSELCRTTTATL